MHGLINDFKFYVFASVERFIHYTSTFELEFSSCPSSIRENDIWAIASICFDWLMEYLVELTILMVMFWCDKIANSAVIWIWQLSLDILRDNLQLLFHNTKGWWRRIWWARSSPPRGAICFNYAFSGTGFHFASYSLPSSLWAHWFSNSVFTTNKWWLAFALFSSHGF